MKKRYEKNIGTLIKQSDQEKLLNSRIAVIGVGGQGAYMLEYLARLGVKTLMFFDGDVYCETNLNRQRFSYEDAIGKNKALTALETLKRINSDIEYIAIDHFFTQKDIWRLYDFDLVVISANIFTKMDYYVLGEFCNLFNIPIEFTPADATGSIIIQLFDCANELDSFLNFYPGVGVEWYDPEPAQQISIPAFMCGMVGGLGTYTAIMFLTRHEKKIIPFKGEFEVECLNLVRPL